MDLNRFNEEHWKVNDEPARFIDVLSRMIDEPEKAPRLSSEDD